LEPYEAVVGRDATAYLSVGYQTGEPAGDIDGRDVLIVAGPEGVRTRMQTPGYIKQAPDGTVFAIREEVDEDGQTPTFLSMSVAALGPDGNPKQGWPFTTTDPSSWPQYGSDGTVYLAQTTDAGDRLIALDADGQIKEGWPYALPGELRWTVCGDGCADEPDTPQVSAAGTVYDSFESGIYVVGPDGQAKDGWPYILPKGTSIPSSCRTSTPGCGPFDPIMADDGRVYVPWYDQRSPTPHDDLICLTPAGAMCPSWPIRLPHGAAGRLEIDEHGNVQVRLFRPDGEIPFTVRPDGTVVH
jgi:hypothetical protein